MMLKVELRKKKSTYSGTVKTTMVSYYLEHFERKTRINQQVHVTLSRIASGDVLFRR